MANCNSIDKVLKRNGTDQFQRTIDDLNPDNFELNDFNIEDWILFAYNFANHLNYFDTDNSVIPSDDWKMFFNDFKLNNEVPFNTNKNYTKEKEKITTLLSAYEKDGKLTPHLTLFVSFLKLVEFSKQRFNGLTKRHLDFYYKEILQVDKLDFTPDTVHTIFELAKRTDQTQIVENTALNAKVDVNGNQLTYNTKEELIVNKAVVTGFKNVYNDVSFKEIKSSVAANTLDGFEEPLPEDKPYWYPFGYTSEESNFIELPDASLGFAIASPMFRLQEGMRKIEITIDFENTIVGLDAFLIPEIIEIFKIYGSGEKKWIGPINLLKKIEDSVESFHTEITNEQLKLAFLLDKEVEAIVNYNQEVLLENHNTKFPLMRFMIDTSKKITNSKGHDLYQKLIAAKIKKITVKVSVSEVKSVSIENDFGGLKSKKPFYPFTAQPLKDSNFFINYEELFSKNWDSINVNLKWKNTPNDFGELYAAYPDNINNEYFTAKKSILYNEDWIDNLSEDNLDNATDVETDGETNTTIIKLFNNSSLGFESKIVLGNNINSGTEGIFDKSGPIKITLEKSFKHSEFPRLYTLALIDEANAPIRDILNVTNTNRPIPNAPYTPLAEGITLSYFATEHITFDSENSEKAYKDNRIQLFHEQAFGQNEIHPYLKTKSIGKGIFESNTDNAAIKLIPTYKDGGEFYIALKDVEVLQSIALLIQVLEGSENTQVDSFKLNEKVTWSILCNNEWKSLENEIISNNIDNFLVSGIIKFDIPREANTDNTLLPKGYVWVRAQMQKKYNAICKVINIHAQAVETSFVNNENDLSHLEKGLPSETINKLITRIPQIKSVKQPYSSFDGIPSESDTVFYRRISERLRHKNRAISLWDYEHLILQKFPEIYKVKCLNHTKDTNFTKAGEVTLIVIPDTVNKNVYDIYEPRVSTGLLNKVTTYINQLNSKLITAVIINPEYETIRIELEAKFLEGYDEIFYQKQLKVDIIKYLSPWAFDDTKEIVFGIELHRSLLIDYLEKLTYVDYLQNVEIYKNGIKAGSSVSPTNPRSVLAAAKEHKVEPVTKVCNKNTEETICQ